MRNTAKKLLSLLLAVALIFSLGLTALAKTSSDAISEPADSERVFYVKVGAQSYSYTWADLAGRGSLKTTTGDYAAKVDGEQATQSWTGVLLADILADVETRSGVRFSADYKIKAVAADDYVVGFTVADVKDAANRYMVAGDPVSNYDGDTKYANSYARILRGAADALSNQANIRCLLGIEILDAAAGALATGSKTQGGDAANSVFYIAVQESAESAVKYYYYTLEELKAYGETHDFAYVDHTVPKTVKGRGVSVANLLSDIADAAITEDMIVQYAESDGYHADAATPIEDSAYKDKVGWLTASHVDAGGDTAAAVDTMVCYETWTTYDHPDENNVNSTQWEDADVGSGYLRAYRQRDDANSAVIKTLMGVVVSYNGALFSGKDGYTLKAVSDSGAAIEIIEPSTGKTYTSQSVTGLVPGMKYAVKAPDVNNAALAAGQSAAQTVTAVAGSAELVVTFTYTEKNYLTVDDMVYTYTTFKNSDKAVQTPSAEAVAAHGAPYGYYDAMYYRYNGVWLDQLAAGANGSITVTGAGGKALTIAAADAGKYFVAYGYTASKSATNVSEGKRYSYAYEAPVLLIPGEGTLVGETEAGAAGNKMVTIALTGVASVQTSTGTGFTDMGNHKWAQEAVNYLFEAGVVKGSGGAYSPAANIKRGDFMLMLYRAYGLEAETAGCFADVAEGSYWYEAIAVAKALGIAQGDGENFRPGDTITRQDALVLLCRTLEMKALAPEKTGDLSAFSDAELVSAYAADAVSALVGAGIVNGSGGHLNPRACMTRAEMAVALYRALTLIK